MQVRSGIAVSPGVVVGPALVLGSENFRIPRKYVNRDAVEVEMVRFRTALGNVCRDIEENEILVGDQMTRTCTNICNTAENSTQSLTRQGPRTHSS